MNERRELRDNMYTQSDCCEGKEKNRAVAGGVVRAREVCLFVCFQKGLGIAHLCMHENDPGGSLRRSVNLISPWPN